MTKLSEVAFRILTVAPETFKRGKPFSCRQLADITGYSKSQVHRGLVELRLAGYCNGSDYDKRGRVQYSGNPKLFLAPDFTSNLKRQRAA